ncbi:MAG: radical SAM protein, partial [Planctomycetota bacterium]|nr:radical SAM protein [Planctomycetota bacterium]
AAGRTRGCLLLEAPTALRALALAHGARDTSGCDFLAELSAMLPLPSHALTGEEMPERHWFYRFAKKRWFFGFGAYG